MPSVQVQRSQALIEAPIPGLEVIDLEGGKVELRGSVDALEAAGCDRTWLQAQGVKGVLAQRTDFVTPEGVILKPYQSDGVPRCLGILRRHGGCILADEMGLGKTPQGAVIAENLRGDGSVLVVCPATVRHQWKQWLTTVSGLNEVDICNLGPPSEKRFWADWAVWEGDATHATVSYNLVERALAARCPDVVIFDEPHDFLQGRANTYVKALWKHLGKVRYKLALDGTPYMAKPAGLWQILNLLLGNRFGLARDFDKRYCEGHEGKHAWDNRGASNIPELTSRLSHFMVRRLKVDVAQHLPKVTYVTKWVEGTTAARAILARMGTSVTALRDAQEPTLEGKIPTVVDIAKETGHPCIVFCWRREDANAVSIAMHKAKEACMVIHGDFPADKRAKMVAEAAKLKCHVAVTYGACATGLDGLQRFSSNVIFHSIDPVPTEILQAVARADREGQTEPVTVTFTAMRDSVDAITVEKVASRIEVWGSIMGRDLASTEVRAALMKGGLGDIENDEVLQALFEEMT